MSLPEAYARLPFAEPARARANLHLVRERLAEPVFALLATVLGQVPDPDAALNYLERFSRDPDAAGRRRVLDALARQPVLLHYLLALFSHSRFLSETLIQQPELITWLARDKHLARVKSKEDLLEEYARFATGALDADPALALARFKRREYLRITLKDILGLAELGETTLELSLLADVLLEKALERAQADLQARYGAPQTTDTRGRLVPARFAVVSLGKLGGQELNYSSDVDLLFLYAGEGETAAPGRIANSEYFIRLAQRLLQLIAGVTSQGAVFRVDMRLRPGGGEGDLAVSLPAALDYYRRQAREWELQVLLKARPSAGDVGLVRDFLRGVEPFLYRGEMHFAAVESVVNAREQFDRKLDAGRVGRLNLKLAPGGIRDIEFLVQCRQRLYGRDDPWVRAPGTLVGLQKLFDKGYLAARDHFRLASAYQFLRRLEHRLQLDQGHQTHTLPAQRGALELVARRCGVAGADELRRQLAEHLREVRAIYERTLPRAARAPEPEEFSLRAPEMPAGPGELSYGAVLRLLREQSSPLAAAVDALDVPPRARKALHRFLAAALSSSATFEQVGRAAAALPLALDLLRLSEPLGALLLRQPERLVELLPLVAHRGAAAGQLAMPLRESGAPGGHFTSFLAGQGSVAEQMGALRGVFRDAVFSWGAREVGGGRSIEEGLRHYTVLTEEVLRASLDVALRSSGLERALPGFAVVALGRLGTAEMDLGSDADLIFVAADVGVQARGRAVAEKFLHVVSAYTREGTLFSVDVRLRPHGSEGELVQTAETFLDYFATTAQAWEAVTYLKARPVAGDPAFGEQLCRNLRAALAHRFRDPGAVRASLAEMRQRLEEEAAKLEGAADNFKTGPGGLYDLDFLAGAAALLDGGASVAHQSLREQVDRWAATAALPDEEGKQLGAAARLLRAVDHALRLATGRALLVLPAGPRGEVVAELAGRWLGEPFTAATLAACLAEQRQAVRAVFRRVFG